jgi:cob(I)alamin adenosyltransferase
MAKLYTKGGDTGKTSLCGGERVEKTDIRVSTCGDIDELNCHIGLLLALMPQCAEQELLSLTQRHLFIIGSQLPVTPASSSEHIGEVDIARLEQAIDRLQHNTPPLDTFVLPGGCQAAAQSHICRAVCRRAERHVVELSHHFDIEPLILSYINRLSDYFFILAIYLNFITETAEKKLYISCK